MTTARLEDRVNSSRISRAFNSLMLTGVFHSNRDLYRIIEEECGYSFGGTRKIVESTSKTGPRDLLEFLQGFQETEEFERLRQKLGNDVHILSSLPKLAQSVMTTYPIISQLALVDFLLELLKPKNPKLKKDNLRDSLFYRPNEKIHPWHYPAYNRLTHILEGSIPIPSKYLRIDFKTYQSLLRFAYDHLRDSVDISKEDFARLIGSAIGISPETVITHLYRNFSKKDIIRGNYSKSRAYYNRLLDFIMKEILITVDLTEPAKIQKELERFNEAIAAEPKRYGIFIKAPKYPDNATREAIIHTLAQTSNSQYQRIYVTDSSEVEKAILSFKLPKKPTPYTAFPANRS